MKIFVTIVVFVIELALIFLPWLPQLGILPEDPTSKDVINAMVMMIGVQGAILIAYLGIMLRLHEQERKADHEILKENNQTMIAGIARGEVRKIRDDEFYVDFLKRAQDADSYVCISYFSPIPPDEVQSPARRHYYDEILKTIRRKGNVRFRRIVRDTPANRIWLAELIPKLQGKPNADLGLLNDHDQSEMPLALSVQVIDCKYSWIVAARSHERVAEYRDIAIDDEVIAGEFRVYHDRLWDASIKLVESGRVSRDGELILQEQGNAASSG